MYSMGLNPFECGGMLLLFPAHCTMAAHCSWFLGWLMCRGWIFPPSETLKRSFQKRLPWLGDMCYILTTRGCSKIRVVSSKMQCFIYTVIHISYLHSLSLYEDIWFTSWITLPDVDLCHLCINLFHSIIGYTSATDTQSTVNNTVHIHNT